MWPEIAATKPDAYNRALRLCAYPLDWHDAVACAGVHAA